MHYLMAASLAPYMKGVPARLKMLCSYFMTDESYAVTYTHFQKQGASPYYFLGSGLNLYLFWGISSILGYLFGNVIPAHLNYVLDFAFAAAFIGMLVPMIKNIPVIASVIASAVISVLGCLYLPGKWYILIASLSASLVGYAVSGIKTSVGIKGENRLEVGENE